MRIQVPKLNTIYKLAYPFNFQVSYLTWSTPMGIILPNYPHFVPDAKKKNWDQMTDFRNAVSYPIKLTLPKGAKFSISNFSLSRRCDRVALKFFKKYGNPWSYQHYFTFDDLKDMEFELA